MGPTTSWKRRASSKRYSGPGLNKELPHEMSSPKSSSSKLSKKGKYKPFIGVSPVHDSKLAEAME